MIPIHDLIGGWVNKFKNSFKLNKAPVDLRNEESNNKSQNLSGNEIRLDIIKDENKKISNHQNDNPKMVPILEMNQIKMNYDINEEKTKYHFQSNI